MCFEIIGVDVIFYGEGMEERNGFIIIYRFINGRGDFRGLGFKIREKKRFLGRWGVEEVREECFRVRKCFRVL